MKIKNREIQSKIKKTAKIVNLHNPSSLMKVVIVEPKKYDEVTTIADHLKQKKAGIPCSLFI